MKTLLKKEFGLTGAVITYLFLFTAGMAMIPNYPILVVTMIVSIGLIVTFQEAREAHDIEYYAILPIRKRDIVKAKFLFVLCMEGLTFVLLTAVVVLRALFLSNAQVYLNNPLMNANPAYLGYVLICFAMFNSFFLTPFFQTGYSFVKPSIFYFLAEFICVGIFEALHHFPALTDLNATKINFMQLTVLAAGVLLYGVMTMVSYQISAKAFEKIDL